MTKNSRERKVITKDNKHKTDKVCLVGNSVKRKPGRPEKVKGQYVKVYLAYQGDREFIDRLRELVKTRNRELTERYRRYRMLNYSDTDAARLVLALKKERATIERQYKKWMRQRELARQKLYTGIVRTFYKAIKKSKATDK